MCNLPEVAGEWLDIPGLTAIAGAEVDLTLPEIVATIVHGGDLAQHRGMFLPDGRRGPVAPPLQRLERLPVPDFDDFPWDRYPGRVIPIMTGRGCSWGRCQFCSDVVTANGRGFRSRPLDELSEQSRRYNSRDVIFLGIKLNSNLEQARHRRAVEVGQQAVDQAEPGVHVQRGLERGGARRVDQRPAHRPLGGAGMLRERACEQLAAQVGMDVARGREHPRRGVAGLERVGEPPGAARTAAQHGGGARAHDAGHALPLLGERGDTVLAVAAEELVGALPGQRDGHARRGQLAQREEADRRQVRHRLVEVPDQPREGVRFAQQAHLELVVVHAERGGDALRVRQLGVLAGEPDRERLERPAHVARHQRDDQARVQAAAQQRADRHVAHQP
jgi:hypothetical protein